MVGAAFEVDTRALAVLRAGLGLCVALELADRWPLLHVFYSDEGTFPVQALVSADGSLSRVACAYAWSGSPTVVRLIAAAHICLALMLSVGFCTRVVAPACWFLYFSLTARNCSIAYIADRYLHVFLLLLVFLPCEHSWSVDARLAAASSATSSQDEKSDVTQGTPKGPSRAMSIVSVATVLARCQLIWIYMDAGYGKVADPEKAWSLWAPVPALDTIMRFTPTARLLRAALGLSGMRLLSATAAWAECCLPSIALLAAAMKAPILQVACVMAMCSLHVGIALCMNNAALLSLTACVAWIIFLPPFPNSTRAPASQPTRNGVVLTSLQAVRPELNKWSSHVLAWFAVVTVAYNIPSQPGMCSARGDGERLWSALLNNRWNAFTSFEDHVTWYIAPAKLLDGSVVDIWAHGAPVSWKVPDFAARTGRWKSFAAVGSGSTAANEAPEALWLYLCNEWNSAHPVEQRVVRYKFFLLSANLSLPSTAADDGSTLSTATSASEEREAFGTPRKRLLKEYRCES